MKFQLNKKLIMTVVLTVGGFMASSSALACYDGEGSGKCGWYGTSPYGAGYGFGGSNSRGGEYNAGSNYTPPETIYTTNFLALYQDGKDKPQIYQDTHYSRSPNFTKNNRDYMQNRGLNLCNERIGNCRLLSSVYSKGCIAYLVDNKGIHHMAANTCQEARENVYQSCMQLNNDQKFCRTGIKTEQLELE